MSKKSISIRPIAPSDKDDWRRLWAAYLAFYETSVSEEVFETSFARLLGSEKGDFCGLIAEIDGQAAGIVHYLFHRHMWKVENTCYLQDLFAAPEFRGKGVGAALINAVYEAADLAGAPSVYWLTQDFNETARRLYDQIGTKTPFIRYNRPA